MTFSGSSINGIKPAPAQRVMEDVRISIQLTNKTGKNINVVQSSAPGAAPVRIASVKNNETTMIPNIKLEQNQYMRAEEIASLQFIDAQENSELSSLLHLMKYKMVIPQKRQIVAELVRPGAATLEESVKVNLDQGAVTVLITVTLGNNPSMDLSILQGPAPR